MMKVVFIDSKVDSEVGLIIRLKRTVVQFAEGFLIDLKAKTIGGYLLFENVQLEQKKLTELTAILMQSNQCAKMMNCFS